MKLDISNWCIIDENGADKRPSNAVELLQATRDLRDTLLKESDWVVVQDCPMDSALRDEWIVWRQWMRDITHNVSVSDSTQYVEIPNPPVNSPKSWANVDFDKRR